MIRRVQAQKSRTDQSCMQLGRTKFKLKPVTFSPGRQRQKCDAKSSCKRQIRWQRETDNLIDQLTAKADLAVSRGGFSKRTIDWLVNKGKGEMGVLYFLHKLGSLITLHSGKKPDHFETTNHSLSPRAREWVSEQENEWAQQSSPARQAGWSKQISERCEWMSEWTSEWPSTYDWILGCSGQLCTEKKERKRNFRREEGKTKEKMRIETKRKDNRKNKQ